MGKRIKELTIGSLEVEHSTTPEVQLSYNIQRRAMDMEEPLTMVRFLKEREITPSSIINQDSNIDFSGGGPAGTVTL
jgi:hypothetical protein